MPIFRCRRRSFAPIATVNSITVAAPLDVIKTRIQNRPFDSPESGFTIVRSLLATEGPTAFFKGLVSIPFSFVAVPA